MILHIVNTPLQPDKDVDDDTFTRKLYLDYV